MEMAPNSLKDVGDLMKSLVPAIESHTMDDNTRLLHALSLPSSPK
jgi:hypothetical protein